MRTPYAKPHGMGFPPRVARRRHAEDPPRRACGQIRVEACACLGIRV